MKTTTRFITALVLIESASAWQLHEWGTFTTVSGSDGVLLSGLQREEETLPPFVHAHFGMENGKLPPIEGVNRILQRHGTLGFAPPLSKGFGERPVANVTVKMETPVIYFHSDKAFQASVKVGFEGGTISQWYPTRSGGEVLPEPELPADPAKSPTPLEKWTIDFSKPYRGGIEWKVDVLSPEESAESLTFKPKDSVNWLRARVPGANVVRTENGELENYLFYRGIGNFTPGLVTRVSSDDTLQLENQSSGDIPYVLAYESKQGLVRWFELPGGIAQGAGASIQETQWNTVSAGFSMPIYQSLRKGLTGSGLTSAEADAMIQTWWSSYFERDGLRVFWIVPRAVTDRVLPLSVEPAPETLVRTLVGRSEVLRPHTEREWLAASRKTGNEAYPWQLLVNSDRFGLAIQERVRALASQTADVSSH